MPSILGVYETPGPVADAARSLKQRGYADLEIYSPAPFSELMHIIDHKPSKVRGWTLIGGLAGVFTGYLMTIWMANDWQIVVGGKPFSSIPTYTVIAFELTILFGGLMTLLGLLVVGKLPYGSFGKTDKAYSSRFSAEDFGLLVSGKDRDVSEVDALLRASEAKEVTLVEP